MTAELIGEAFHFGPDQAKWVRGALGIEVRMLVGGEDTGGALTMYQYTAPPGYPGPAFHVHHHEDEAFFVLDGTLTVRSGPETIELGRGGFAWAPAGSRTASATPATIRSGSYAQWCLAIWSRCSSR